LIRNDTIPRACKLSGLLGHETTRAARLAWIGKLLRIPAGLLTAHLSAHAVTLATEGKTPALLKTVAAALAVVLLSQLLIFLIDTAFRKLEAAALHQSRLRLYRLILSAPLHRLYQADHGQLVTTLDQDLTTVINRQLKLLPSVLTGLITTAAYALLIGFGSPILLPVMLVFGLVQLIPPIIVRKKLQINYTECREIEARESNFVLSAFHGFTLIRLYGLKDWWQEGLAALHREEMRVGSRAESASTVQGILFSLTDAILKYGTCIAAAVFVLYGLVELPAAVQAIALSADLYAAIKTVCSEITGFAVAGQAQSHLAEWDHPQPAVRTPETLDTIVFSDVGLSFKDHAVLSDFTATLDTSRITLIKGVNGSGKSTLLRLMTGQLLCDSGELCVGGVDPVFFPAAIFPGGIFSLPQEEPAYDFTAEELFSMLSLCRQAETIAKRFHLSSELLSGQKIRELSGGERKKVFLSLGFALNPALLLLDEPTNSLDGQAKEVLLQLLRERGGRAVIVTHDRLFDALPDTKIICMGGVSNDRT